MPGRLEEYFEKVCSGGYVEEVSTDATVTGATDIDLDVANVFRHTLTGNVTYSIINETATPAVNSFVLILVQDGTGSRTVTWPAEVEWDGGTAPTLTSAASGKDMITFISPDAGTTWVGIVAAQDIS